MKRNYIIPSSTAVEVRTELICQVNVGSVQGNSDMHLGGGGGNVSPIEPI